MLSLENYAPQSFWPACLFICLPAILCLGFAIYSWRDGIVDKAEVFIFFIISLFFFGLAIFCYLDLSPNYYLYHNDPVAYYEKLIKETEKKSLAAEVKIKHLQDLIKLSQK